MRGRETLIAIGIIGSGVDSRQSNSLASLASPATPGDLCANDADGARPASGALRRHLREYMSFPEESQPITAGPEFHLAILNPQSSIGHRPSSIVHRPSSIVNRESCRSPQPRALLDNASSWTWTVLLLADSTLADSTLAWPRRAIDIWFVRQLLCPPAPDGRRNTQDGTVREDRRSPAPFPHFPNSPILPTCFKLRPTYIPHCRIRESQNIHPMACCRI